MNISGSRYKTVDLIMLVTLVIIVAATFNSCGYGDGDKHPDVKPLLSLNSYPEKFRLLHIKTDKGKLRMTAWKDNDANSSDRLDYNNDIYRVFPGKDSWYYIGQYDDTFFDCNMEILHIPIKDICGSEDFKLYPLEAGKIYIDVYANDPAENESHKSSILLVDMNTRKVYKQFEYINPWLIPNILQYMEHKGDTESYPRYEKEIKLFYKIYPQAQQEILQLMDKYPDHYIANGDTVRSFNLDKVYHNLLTRLQYADSTASSNKATVCQRYRQLFFINHSVAIGYNTTEWEPDSIIPSLSNFKRLPAPQNLANVQLHQFDYSLVRESMPHLLKGSATRDELYYYNISVGNDTLQFKYSEPVYLFESRRLKNGKVIIALSANKEFKSKDYSQEASGDLSVTEVFFLLYDPEFHTLLDGQLK